MVTSTVTRRRFLGLAGGAGVGLLAAAAGVACAEDAPAEEPTVRFGEESCARCSMVIDDRRFAAAWIAPDNKEQHFDDVACLVRAMDEGPPPSGTRYFVSDYHNESWLDAATATFVHSDRVKSPMASGIAAVASAAAAQQLAAELDAPTAVWPTHAWSAIGHMVGEDSHAPDSHSSDAHGSDGHGS